MRSRFEPLIEMMQIKGNSEVHRWFWAADEFANFENADSLGDYSGRDLKKFGKTELGALGRDQGPRVREVPRREPLSLRLRRRHRQPQRHSLERRRRQLRRSAATARPTGRSNGGGRARSAVGSRARTSTPASLTGVWAPQNTREAIWDGLKARETFVTSGPRVKVRFFGRLGAGAAPADARSLVEAGYATGRADGRDAQGRQRGARPSRSGR